MTGNVIPSCSALEEFFFCCHSVGQEKDQYSMELISDSQHMFIFKCDFQCTYLLCFPIFLILVKAVLKKREYGPKYTQNNFITGVRAINEFCLKSRYSDLKKCGRFLYLT